MLSKKLFLNTKSLDELEELLNEYITKNSEEILEYTLENFTIRGMRANTWRELQALESLCGFDCGWLKVSFADNELSNHVKKLYKRAYRFNSESIILHLLPLQSTTIGMVAFEKFKELLMSECSIETNAYVTLD